MTRHSFDPLSLVFGLLFAAVAAMGLIGPVDLRHLDLAWVGPAVLVALGLIVLLTARSAPRPAADAHERDAPERGAAAEAVAATPPATDAAVEPDPTAETVSETPTDPDDPIEDDSRGDES